MKRNFTATGPVQVDIRFEDGLCEISPRTGTEIGVEVEPFTVNNENDRKAADSISIEFMNDVLSITPEKKNPLQKLTTIHSGKVRIAISIPNNSSVSLDTSSGALNVSDGVIADLSVDSGSGDITVAHAAGDLRIRNSSGHIKFGQVDSSLQIDTGSSSATIEQALGDVKMETSSGDLTIGVAAGKVQFNSGSGEVKISEAHGKSINVKTSSGNISVGVPQHIMVYTNIKSANGLITGDLVNNGPDTPSESDTLKISVDTASGNTDVHRIAASKN